MDDSTMAHLHLGLLAYWLVNTVRYQLKQQGINSDWREIIRKKSVVPKLEIEKFKTTQDKIVIRI